MLAFIHTVRWTSPRAFRYYFAFQISYPPSVDGKMRPFVRLAPGTCRRSVDALLSPVKPAFSCPRVSYANAKVLCTYVCLRVCMYMCKTRPSNEMPGKMPRVESLEAKERYTYKRARKNRNGCVAYFSK